MDRLSLLNAARLGTLVAHAGIRIEEMPGLTHHSFVVYTLPTTGE